MKPFHKSFLLAGALLSATLAHAATCTWTGGTGNWSVPTNWSCGAVPGANDDVAVANGTITLDADVAVRDLTLAGGTITGAKNLSIGRALVLRAGTLSGSGTTTVAGAATFDGQESKNIGRRLVLKGLSTWSNGTLQMRDGGAVVNEGIFNDVAVGTHSIARVGTIAVEPLVLNEGTWTVASGGTNANVAFSNAGTFAITGPVFGIVAPGRFDLLETGLLVGPSRLDFGGSVATSFSGRTQPGGVGLVGDQELRGAVTMGGRHVLDVDIASATSYDRLTTSAGNVSIGGRLQLRLLPGAGAGVYTVVTHSGSGAPTGCYAADSIAVTMADGITAAPFRATAACTNGAITATVVQVSSVVGEARIDASRYLRIAGMAPGTAAPSIAFEPPASGPATVAVYDLLGRRRHVLYDASAVVGQTEQLSMGEYALASGAYVVVAEGPGYRLARQLIL